jgi:prepilin-type N-terminal cleavage/methylation domain-containing protein
MRILKSRKGFTMLELLMVVIVIGILASLAIPQYQSFMEKARAAEAKNFIGAIRNAQELYYLAHNIYGDDGQINPNYIEYVMPGDPDALFSYSITAADADGYSVEVYSKPKSGRDSGPPAGEFIWKRTTSTATWIGNVSY